MSAVQIAGCSGAGKSAVAAVLARRGLVAIDSDDDPFLARFVDPAGAVVAESPAAPGAASCRTPATTWSGPRPASGPSSWPSACPRSAAARLAYCLSHPALGRRPQLLLLDEPVAMLDPVARHDFMAAVLTS